MDRHPDVPGRRDAEAHGSRSLTGMLDSALLVVVSVVAVLIVLRIIGLVAGTIFFMAKLLLLAAVVYGGLRLVLRRR